MAGEEVKKRINPVSKLNERMMAFCIALMDDPEKNQTAAAIKAGYSESHAHVHATQLLKKPKIQAFLDKLRSNAVARANRTTDELIKEQENIAFSDIADYLDFDGSGVYLKPLSSIPRNKRAAIAGVSQKTTKDGTSIEFKLWDKNKAIDMLNRIHKQYEGPVNPGNTTINNNNAVVFVIPKFEQSNEKNAVKIPYEVMKPTELPKTIKLNGNGSNHNGSGK